MRLVNALCSGVTCFSDHLVYLQCQDNDEPYQKLRCWLRQRRQEENSSEEDYGPSMYVKPVEKMVWKRKGKAALRALAKQLLANRKNILNVSYPNERKLLPRLY